MTTLYFLPDVEALIGDTLTPAPTTITTPSKVIPLHRFAPSAAISTDAPGASATSSSQEEPDRLENVLLSPVLDPSIPSASVWALTAAERSGDFSRDE